MNIRIALVGIGLFLAGCAETTVTEFNGDSVKVQVPMQQEEVSARAAAQVEADRLCRSRGRSAEYQTREFDSSEDLFANELFFICI